MSSKQPGKLQSPRLFSARQPIGISKTSYPLFILRASEGAETAVTITCTTTTRPIGQSTCV